MRIQCRHHRAVRREFGGSEWESNPLRTVSRPFPDLKPGRPLVTCAPQQAKDILQTIVAEGYPFARIIGGIEAGPAVVQVES
jgi:hypothetical protein